MQSFKHPNVMSLIGVCENFCGGPAVVMPFMANGSTLDYLKRERKSLMLDGEAEGNMVCCMQFRFYSVVIYKNANSLNTIL